MNEEMTVTMAESEYLTLKHFRAERDAATARAERAERLVEELRVVIEDAIEGFNALATTPEPTEADKQ